MRIQFTKQFVKSYKKLPKNIQNLCDKKLQILCDNSKSKELDLHQLKGNKFPLWSIDISHDYRALFLIGNDIYIFNSIGTHSQLY